MYLFFDTETTGKPKNYKAPMQDLDNWPRVIQLAWLLTDEDGNHLSEKEYLIKPDGWVIPVEDFWIQHGFNTEKSELEGRPIVEVLREIINDMERAEYMISHNMEFDKNILGSEMIRYNMRGKKLAKICTMTSSTNFCAIPYGGERAWLSKQSKRYKWPKLGELHKCLFGEEMKGGHQASEDVTALKRCFFGLLRMGIIIPKQYIGK